MLTDTVVVIDFETTGLDHQWDRATEVAAVRLENGRITDRYQSLINAGLSVPIEVTELTGISTEMLRNAPDPHYVFSRLRQFIGEASIFAHNAKFDYKFYKKTELRRAGFQRTPAAISSSAVG